MFLDACQAGLQMCCGPRALVIPPRRSAALTRRSNVKSGTSAHCPKVADAGTALDDCTGLSAFTGVRYRDLNQRYELVGADFRIGPFRIRLNKSLLSEGSRPVHQVQPPSDTEARARSARPGLGKSHPRSSSILRNKRLCARLSSPQQPTSLARRTLDLLN